MGIIVSYEVINNPKIISEIEKNKNTDFEIEIFLDQNKIYIQSFPSFVKSWNPLYSLLNKISENNIFNKLSRYESGVEFNEYTKIFSNDEVEILFNILEKISTHDIMDRLKDESLKNKISKEDGYHMEDIFHRDSILFEFQELKKAFNTAFNENSQVVQILFP
ncbi:hypothetical protein HNP38_001607 [Chryseobacterium defluvii]|uniref:DUF1877 family protein n=1 Tax=Chryseobacterium defluvii TaxID=160396 RepID=A0A840KCU7_9FLAO|nr:DUF1877 family protein [Chryseobacterium defluvii]MBB4806335.1 hypothetical protein [Chryseobacterium defluvii]